MFAGVAGVAGIAGVAGVADAAVFVAVLYCLFFMLLLSLHFFFARTRKPSTMINIALLDSSVLSISTPAELFITNRRHNKVVACVSL